MPLYSYFQSKLKHLLVLMSFSILSISSNVIANDEVLAYPFNADSGRYWQYVSDRVMGGVSDGKVNLEQDGEMAFD